MKNETKEEKEKKIKALKEDLEKAGFSGAEKQDLKNLGDLTTLFAILSKHDVLGEVKIIEHTEEYHDRIKHHKKIMEDIRAENSKFKFNKK